METRVKKWDIFSFYAFKSYYVVWKHFDNFFFIHRIFMFKSYYVVWKHEKIYFRLKRMRCRLNRTMQYGNSNNRIFHPEYIHRLNRTMQYGNKRSPLKIVFPREQFKSYYVVWKPKAGGEHSNSLQMFKSYYVVWKLPFPMSFSPSQRVFKSYYVVWKLFFEQKIRQHYPV